MNTEKKAKTKKKKGTRRKKADGNAEGPSVDDGVSHEAEAESDQPGNQQNGETPTAKFGCVDPAVLQKAREAKSQYSVMVTSKTNSYKMNKNKNPVAIAMRERIRSENVQIINDNLHKFKDEELKHLEDYFIKRNAPKHLDLFDPGSHKYRVNAKMDEGRHSFIYFVDIDEMKAFAVIKVDKRKHDSKLRMQNDVNALTALKTAKASLNPFRFPTLIDSYVSPNMKSFIVMNILGLNIDQIRVTGKGGILHKKSILLLATESLKAICDLHSIGYIHRDIKPSNFCVGHDKKDCTALHLVDFTAACKETEKKIQEALIQREALYPLTNNEIIFCPPETHKNECHTRRSDLVSWFFMVCDLFEKDALPWRKDHDDLTKVAEKKIEFMRGGAKELIEKLPECMGKVYGMMDESQSLVPNTVIQTMMAAKLEMDKQFATQPVEWANIERPITKW